MSEYTGPNLHTDLYFNLNDENAGQAFIECPCTCGLRYTEDDLTTHLFQLAEASTARWAQRYAASGLEMSSKAVRSIWDTYGDYLTEAIGDDPPDWRNSDGLRGYANSVVRIISE